MISSRMIAPILICAGLAGGPAFGQVGDLPEAAPDAETANTPGEFARLSIMAHQFQIQAGEVVAQAAPQERLAQYARETAEQHAELQQDLIRHAELEGLSRSEMPRILDAPDRERIFQLEDAADDEVGAMYLEMQRDRLADAAALLRNYSQKGGRLAEFAASALPVIIQQYERAVRIADEG